MKCFYCLMLLLCPFGSFAANPPFKALKVGDKVPDIYFENIIHSTADKANLYSFKKKLMILNFWATTCGTCIHKLPLLDSMQAQYPADLSVLLINSSVSDTKEKVEKLFKRITNGDARGFGLPVIIGDTIANQLFRHKYVPHYAWLNADFTIAAITGSEDLVAEKIQSFIEGKKVTFFNKEDMEDFKPGNPLFIAGNGGNGSQVMARTTWSNFISGLPTGTYVGKDKYSKINKLLFTNYPLLNLILYAYDIKSGGFNIQMEPDVSRNLSLEGQPDDWIAAHSFTYELITPPVSLHTAKQWMQQDLLRQFGYSVSSKIVPVNCWVIQTDTLLLKAYKTKGGNKKNNLADSDRPFLHNRPVSDIMEFFQRQVSIPVVNEAGPLLIDIELPAYNSFNVKTFAALLARFGIYLREEQRNLTQYFIFHQPN